MGKFEALAASMLLFFASGSKAESRDGGSEPEPSSSLEGLQSVTENKTPHDAKGLEVCDKGPDGSDQNCEVMGTPETKEAACTANVCPPKPSKPAPR